MTEIIPNLFVGDEQDCKDAKDMYIIHACKFPCFKAEDKNTERKNDQFYNLWFVKNNDLYLNMIDPEEEYYHSYANPLIKRSLHFIQKNIAEHKILVHCNKGQSRSASIILIYLARIGKIQNDKFKNAFSDFQKIYPEYLPGMGIFEYMRSNWKQIMEMIY